MSEDQSSEENQFINNPEDTSSFTSSQYKSLNQTNQNLAEQTSLLDRAMSQELENSNDLQLQSNELQEEQKNMEMKQVFLKLDEISQDVQPSSSIREATVQPVIFKPNIEKTQKIDQGTQVTLRTGSVIRP